MSLTVGKSILARIGAAALVLATAAPTAAAQNQLSRVIGVVTDERSTPIANARVSIPGTEVQTHTDAAGRFRLDNVNGDDVPLQVTIIGFRPLTQTVRAGDANVRLVMVPAAVSLDEIVVTGTAGVTQRRAVGNVVSTIDATKLLASIPTPNVDQLLSARTPGLIVLPASGQAGTSSPIRIRGMSSMSLVNEPIVFIDGIRMDADPRQGPVQRARSGRVSRLSDVNPDDIQSIEIIKGPSAATLYGTEASNGVIQIITKRGVSGKPQLDLAFRRGTNWLVNPAERLGLRWGPNATTGELESVNLYEFERLNRGGPIFSNGPLQGYSANLKGGNDAFRYFASAAYDDDQGVVAWNWDRRFSVRSNMDLVLTEKLNGRVNVGYTERKVSLTQTNYNHDPYSNLLYANPRTLNAPLQGWFVTPPSEWGKVKSRADNDRVLTSLELTYNPTSWFNHRFNAGIDLNQGENWTLHPRQPQGAAHFWGQDGLGSKVVDRVRRRQLSLDYSGSAKYNLLPEVQFTSSVGFQYYGRARSSITATGRDFPALPITTVSGGSVRTSEEAFEENSTVGVYVQQQVGWRNRVFVTGAIRGDDNSAFGADYDAAIYPKLSASWVVHEEPFFNVGWVNQLKLRSAWGAAGLQPGTFDAPRLWDPTIGHQDQPGLIPGAFGNPALKPERSEELEYGIDATLLNERLDLGFTRYHRWTKDAIVNRPVPPSTGFFGSQIVNLGRVRGWGNELSINARLARGARFGWEMGAQIASNGNRIEDLGDLEFIAAGVRQEHRAGYPIGAIFVKKVLSAKIDAGGFVTEALCDGGSGSRGLDQGGAAVPCASAPRLYWSPSLPTWQLGINSTFTLFRNLSLFVRVEGNGGHHSINTELRATHNLGLSEVVLRRNDAMVQATRAVENDVMGLHDAAFAKLREVAATYTLPPSWVRGFGASRGAISLSARNIMMLWTGAHGFNTPRDNRVTAPLGGLWVWDPELRGVAQVDGEHQTIMPPTTSVNMTVRLSF